MAKIGIKRKAVDSLYVGKSTIFKIFLLGGVAIISALFIWYTFDVIDELKEDPDELKVVLYLHCL